MKYTKKELEITKDAIKEYDYISRYINHEIKDGASMKQLYDYVTNEFNVDITNYELSDMYKYIDFNYGNITCSIISTNKIPTFLSKDISVWNDKDLYVIFDNFNIDELKKIVKESDK